MFIFNVDVFILKMEFERLNQSDLNEINTL